MGEGNPESDAAGGVIELVSLASGHGGGKRATKRGVEDVDFEFAPPNAQSHVSGNIDHVYIVALIPD